MGDIFNLDDIADLPANLVKELKLTTKKEEQFLNLFREKSPLNINQVMVAWYRKHNKVRTRTDITASLYRLHKKGLIKPTKNKGEYSL